MQPEPLIAELAGLLPPPAVKPGGITVETCAAGGNNRVFTVTAGNRKFVAKFYFRHLSDTRNRLKSEYAFLSYARRIGIKSVPAPIACDVERGIGVYEHIEGTKLTPREIDAVVFGLAMLAVKGEASGSVGPSSKPTLRLV